MKRELHFGEKTPEERLSLWTKYVKGDPRDQAYLERYPLLAKLIQEDFEKYPEIKKKFEMKMKQWKREEKMKRTLFVLGFLWVVVPSVYFSIAYHWIFGFIWFLFWCMLLFFSLKIISLFEEV